MSCCFIIVLGFFVGMNLERFWVVNLYIYVFVYFVLIFFVFVCIVFDFSRKCDVVVFIFEGSYVKANVWNVYLFSMNKVM